jgi:3-oxoacyl-[acyl-carrier-protein] synthase I
MSLFIRSYAAVTPVGLDAASAAAAVRAGIAAQGEHPFMVDRHGAPMIVARVPVLTQDSDAVPRLLELALPALLEVVGLAPADRELFLLVALPEPRPGLPEDYPASIEREILRALAGRRHHASLRCIPHGAAGGLELFGEAWRLLRERPAAAVLVGGVDSHLVPDTLEWWDSQHALHSEAMPWGFCPGEAAAFCVVTAETGPGLRVLSLGAAREPNPIRTETVCAAEGLTVAWSQALARARCVEGGLTRILCDLDGEPYRAEEYGFTMLRQGRFVAEDAAFETPARCWGNVGAAFGPLAVMLAGEAAARGYAPGPRTLAFAGSDSGRRAALILEAA